MSHPESEHPAPENPPETHIQGEPPTPGDGHGHDEAHSHGETHAHSSPPVNPFTPEELAALHAEDRTTARNVVSLMASIFVAGVIGYTIVSLVVRQG